MGKKTKVKEKIEETVEVSEAPKSILKFLGTGPLSGEYRFEGIAGSIGAGSLEEAIEKANDIALKHPSLLVK